MGAGSRVPDALRRGATIVFAAAFLVAGIGVAVLFWTRDRSYYASYAREARLADQAYHAPGGGTQPVTLEVLVRTDDELRDFVLDPRREPPAFPRAVHLSPRELWHLRDVARIYALLQPLTVVASLAALAGLFLHPRTLRRIVLAEAAVVLALGIVAAFAFEPAFLIFHQVLFPQGNFLFDPRTDNIVLLYPEGYWLGVTLRVGAAFLLIALAVGALASLSIRFRRDQGGGGTVRA